MSQSRLIKTGWKTFYFPKLDQYLITKGNNKITFKQVNGLYIAKLIKKNINNLNKTIIKDITKSEAYIRIQDDGLFNQNQKDRAKRARELHIALGHPGNTILGSMLDNGQIYGSTLTSNDLTKC